MDSSQNNYLPPKIENNPGVGVSGKCAFTNGNDTWEEEFNLPDNLRKIFDNNKIQYKLIDDFIIVENIFFKPEMVGIKPLENKDVRTVTIISYFHENLVRSGSFEFQHSVGSNINESVDKGFSDWFSCDFPVITESILDKPKNCTTMVLKSEICSRKIFLGPAMHLVKNNNDVKEEHPFCQCCFITNNFQNFEKYLTGSDFYGIRMYAIRDADGHINADCRINGIDYESGKNMLIEYVKTWPDRGFEVRKQYVIARNA